MSHSDNDPTRNTLFQIKKISAGEISKKQRVFVVGHSGQTCPLGGGASLALRAKMGSSGFVKSHQESIFSEIVARMGGFFFGCTKRRPDVFRGEMGNWARREPRFFVTAASGGFLVK